ncbi:cell division inhibitor [Aeromonas schubertii]|uniref:cell division inhibitor n=1 Tax=Aeromonas schubertii TaxID=652 RepID=UPI0011874BDD|nr:cell division inhibitor [Aeromonas schubertii]MBZ6072106.1 cell division inhibitor [Aeromonas schubertii]
MTQLAAIHSHSSAFTSWPRNRPCLRPDPAAQDTILDLLKRTRLHTGWILLLAPPGAPSAADLQSKGIDPTRVLLLPRNRIKNWQGVLEKSLGNGCFSAVLGWLPEDIDLDFQRLDRSRQATGTLMQIFVPPLCHPFGQNLFHNH